MNRVIGTCCLAVCLTPSNTPLDGRWDVTFDIPSQQYRAILEFAVSSDGTVTTTNLVYPLLTVTEGHFTDGTLSLKGTSPYGPVGITTAIAGTAMTGKWQVAMISGAVRGSRMPDTRSAVRPRAVFDAVWDTLNRQYYDPQFNGVDWRAMRARYRPNSDAARTDGQLVTVIRKMFADLHSSHLELSALPLDKAFVATPATGTSATAAPIVWRNLSPAIGYLQITQFEESPEILGLVDRVFTELGDLPSLIIDVRGNPGGTLSAAMRLGDYLFPATRPAGYFVTRAGLARFKVQSAEQIPLDRLAVYSGYSVVDFRRELTRSGAVMLTTGGRAAAYQGRVVLLIDERCGSTTEGFASMVKETHAATLIGRRTAGAMLSSVEVPVVGGWTLRYPEADFRTASGQRVEGQGVEPDIVVQKSVIGDADLARAMTFLQKLPRPR